MRTCVLRSDGVRGAVRETFNEVHPQLGDVLVERYVENPRCAHAKSILVPVGGAKMMRRVQALSAGKFVLIVMDKGHMDIATLLESDPQPHAAEHGALSFMTNFDCLAALHVAAVNKAGGPKPVCLRTEQSDGLVKTVALVSGIPHSHLGRFAREFRVAVAEGTPDDISSLHRGIKAEIPKQRIPLILATAVLRLVASDPDVFYKFREPLIDKSGPSVASVSTQTDLRGDAELALARHFYMSSEKDVAFEAGRVFMSLRSYEDGYRSFEASEENCGQHHVTAHNKGICLYFLNRFHEADE
jgi:hypothetical protein